MEGIVTKLNKYLHLFQAMSTDDPVVLCAPTGSGKTVLFEMAVIRLLMNCQQSQTLLEDVKIIYSKFQTQSLW